MAKWWKEEYDPHKHVNEMKSVVDGEYQYNFDFSSDDNLLKTYVILVRVVQFTFIFLSLRQLEVCIEYFEQKVHGSTMISGGIGAADHWEVQRWFERLPKGLTSDKKRPTILKALCSAKKEFLNDKEYNPVIT